MDDLKKFFEKLLRKNLFVFFLLFFLAAICYSNSLFNNFVSDDWGIFMVSYAPKAIFPNIKALFTNYPEQLFRAVLINTKLTAPIFFRLPNILAHLGSSYLIFLIISLLHKRKTALYAGILFAVHPILIESVTWISGGPYAKYAFFFLLSFWFYLKSSRKKIYYYFSVFSFYFSLLAGEKAIPLFLIFPLSEVCFGDLRKNWGKIIPFFLLSLVKVLLLLPAAGVYQTLIQTQFYQEKVFHNPLVQIPIAVTSYLELIFWPDKLTLYHSELSFTQTAYFVRLSLFIIYLTALFFSFFKNKYLFFWSSFFLISLLITLNPWGFGWVAAERYVYLGTLGIIAIVAYFMNKLSNNKKMQLLIFVAYLFIIVLLCLRTMTRNLDWQNEDNLWLSAARTSPSSPQNHNNLGDLYGRNGNYQRALEEFQTAIILNPKYADAYHNLSNTYQQIGDIENAIKNYQKATVLNPLLWQSWQNLAVIYYNKKDYPKAVNCMSKAYAINPDPLIKKNLELMKQAKKSINE